MVACGRESWCSWRVCCRASAASISRLSKSDSSSLLGSSVTNKKDFDRKGGRAHSAEKLNFSGEYKGFSKGVTAELQYHAIFDFLSCSMSEYLPKKDAGHCARKVTALFSE